MSSDHLHILRTKQLVHQNIQKVKNRMQFCFLMEQSKNKQILLRYAFFKQQTGKQLFYKKTLKELQRPTFQLVTKIEHQAQSTAVPRNNANTTRGWKVARSRTRLGNFIKMQTTWEDASNLQTYNLQRCKEPLQ